MSQAPYPYNHPYSERYVFISVGRLRIEKVVDFIPIGIKNIVNMGFGDRLQDGSIDDTASSNNGDLVKVLATVIAILKDFDPELETEYLAFLVERIN